jgi:tetratricopeptide (TPR) repeat protein
MPSQPNEPFDLSEARLLFAAEGWLELGNWREAEEELKNIPPDKQHCPAVLVLRFQIFAKALQWERASETAKEIATTTPDDSFGWVHWAYALHELKRTQQAYDVVSSVVARFPQEATMRYNLACYSCQLDKPEEAMGWLKQAFTMDEEKKFRELALEDQDLKPLWKQIRGMQK